MLRRLIRSALVWYIRHTPRPMTTYGVAFGDVVTVTGMGDASFSFAALGDDDWSQLADGEMLRRVVSG